jgi:hypothetical protein
VELIHSDRDQAKDYSIFKLKMTAFTEIETKDIAYPFSQTAGRQPHMNMIILFQDGAAHVLY